MMQGILPFVLEVDHCPDAVTGRAGLPLVVETMRALKLDEVISQELRLRGRHSGYSETEKIEALALLMASGGECVDDIRVLQADAGLLRLLDRQLPSPDALLQFLYLFHDEALIKQAQQARPTGTVAYIPGENAALRGLDRVNRALVQRVAAQGEAKKATVDLDATIQQSHKREALFHYEGGRGYQPVAAYWVEADLVLTDEYRDGNVPAGMSNLPVVKRAFQALPKSVTEYYFRADSACYDETVLKWLANAERQDGPAGLIGFTISADMTPELRKICQAVPVDAWTVLEERVEETVMCTEVVFTPGNWSKSSWPLRYLALRIQRKQGRLFEKGMETKYLAVVTNRAGKIADLVRWHWQKAGTIELLHDVTKNELAAAVPPCGRFGANAAWYRLSLLTHNVLSAMKSLALAPKLSSARPKRLRFTVFTLAARIVSHAGRLLVRVSAQAEEQAGLLAARLRLSQLQAALP
jgi:hypothetical protein